MHPDDCGHPFEAWALGLLCRGDLASKLAAPPAEAVESLSRHEGRAVRSVEAPAREPDLALGRGRGALPRPGGLGSPRARARCLARFAHHELMAVELFAWALLRWPEIPVALARALLAALRDEQRHCRLYLDRLADLGDGMADHAPHSGYFWLQAPAIAASPDGAAAFLAAMGLTLEQANLDFMGTYADAFERAGDPESARVCRRIREDEIRHVRLAVEWLPRLVPGAEGTPAVDLYERAVPFPLSPARAKGRHFDAGARRRAGLDEAFIRRVREARSRAQSAGEPPRGGAG